MRTLLALLLLWPALIEGAPGEPSCPTAVLAPSLLKVRPGSPHCGTEAPFSLSLAQNEYESFQVVVNGDAKLLDLSLSFSPADGDADAHACAAALAESARPHTVGYMEIAEVSDCDGALGRWPDVLVPFKDDWYGEERSKLRASPVPRGENRAFWVDLFAPPGCRAGSYSGAVQVTLGGGSAGGNSSVLLPLSLRVFDFELPSTSGRYRTTYGLDFLPTVMGAYREAWQEHRAEAVGLLEKYLELGLMNRASLTHSGGPLADPALQEHPVDWEAFEARWGDLLSAKGRELPYGLDGARLTSLQVPIFHLNTSEQHGGSAFEKFQRELYDHAGRHGWSHLLFSKPCDEPHDAASFDFCRAAADALHAAVPEAQVMVTTDIFQAQKFEATGYIDVLCPLINFVENSREHCSDYPEYSMRNTRETYTKTGYDGHKLWWYQSCMSDGCGPGISGSGGCDPENVCRSGWPSYMVDAPAVMNRAMSWLSYLYDVSGELYWGSNWVDGCNRDHGVCKELFPKPGPWGMDAWKSILAQGGNGDGQLTYPGRPEIIGGEHVVPLASLRLKSIRDGLEDLEYLYLLESLTDRQEALSFVHQLANNTFTYTRDIGLVAEVKEKIGRAIEAAKQRDGHREFVIIE